MKLTYVRTIQVTSCLLLVLAATQALYTVLYIAELQVPRQLLWGLEAILFTLLIPFAGAALVQSKQEQLGWSAIVFSAVLNVVQVSIGLTLFGPFREASNQMEVLGPIAGAVVALSFMIYFAAKLLLGFSAFVFGFGKMVVGDRVLGGVTGVVGAIAVVSNGVLIMFGRDAFMPSSVAGGSGVLATLLLAFCLMKSAREA